ncbi:ubiquitin-associated protein 2a isoform X2 [Narcine bancroftii]|uniref:ubiquitin-associated protein 2a isoform X2 n=1 Tax=Narcine bancroftii TaxID=1343680 RepID=UPI0038310F86
MMISVSNDRSRGTRDKTQAQTHAQIQKPVQATAEQIRLAQMIYDKNDVDFEEKVKQLMEVTGKNPDESIVALHDCNGDVNRAIDTLIEGNSDTNSWETVGKKKSLGTGKDNVLENKENRDKRGVKEVSQMHGSSSRRGKGNRGREYKIEENGVDSALNDRHSEQGRRGRSRGYGGRSRDRGAARFSTQGMGTFNPADYRVSTTDRHGTTSEIWEAGQNNGTSTWQNSMEDCITEDCNEDHLTETKVFTASMVARIDNQITPASSTDLATLLQKPSNITITENHSNEAPQQGNLSQPLVFISSQNDPISSVEGKSNAVNSYSQNPTSIFGELAATKIDNSTGLQSINQLKPLALVEMVPQSAEQSNNKLSWEAKSTSQPAVLNHFDLKIQPNPSPVLSQIIQQPKQSSIQPGMDSFPSQVRLKEPSSVDGTAAKVMQMLPISTDNQMTNMQQTQQKQLKTQKRKLPPSKIPMSAVEMPRSIDVSGLNVQFGALEFGSEPSLTEFQTGSTENTSQTQNHLFSNSVSLTVAQNTPVTSRLDQIPVHGMPYQNSLDTSPQKEVSLPNSYNGLGAQQALEVPPPSSNLNQTIELPISSLAQHSSSLPNHQTSNLSSVSSLTASSLHAHPNIESSSQTSTTLPTPLTFATITTSSVYVSSSSSTANSLGLSISSPSMVAAATRTIPSMSSGKAPPNLPQSVPPVLHNQYIVGPGGLLPAYPIYGYDDLQVLQSRLPMDYYGMAFPAPATALASRDGNLASNPYSGDLVKFGRGDSASPAPTTLAQPQQNQTQSHHTTQQAFLNPALPPGYSYTGLPYYAGIPGVPSTFQYGPALFVPPASAKHSMNMNTTSAPFQQASSYGQHGYGTGYDELNQGTGGGDYSKGAYSGSTQAQTKSSTAGPGKGISVNSTNIGVPDITGSVYKTQSFDKHGFHAGTPPPFTLPSPLGGTGTLNPSMAPGGYAPPFLHLVSAHQQAHSQMLHHQLQQDNQGGSGPRNQQSSIPQKSQVTKPNYGVSPYWGN